MGLDPLNGAVLGRDYTKRCGLGTRLFETVWYGDETAGLRVARQVGAVQAALGAEGIHGVEVQPSFVFRFRVSGFGNLRSGVQTRITRPQLFPTACKSFAHVDVFGKVQLKYFPWVQACVASCVAAKLLFFFFTLVAGPRRSLSLNHTPFAWQLKYLLHGCADGCFGNV